MADTSGQQSEFLKIFGQTVSSSKFKVLFKRPSSNVKLHMFRIKIFWFCSFAVDSSHVKFDV